jgi:fructose-1,6-bisphosphatase
VKIAEYDKTKVNAGKGEPEGIANNTEKKGPGVDKKNDVDATTTVKNVDIPKENTKKVDVASNDQISENIFKAIDQ